MSENANRSTFALLGHPAGYEHFVRLVESADGPAVAQRLRQHKATFLRFIDWTPSYATKHRPILHSQHGDIEGRLIVCPFLPQQITSPSQMKRAYEKVAEGCRIAAELGTAVVALGGFTSIVAGPQADNLASSLGLTITSGNSLTAALAVAQLKEAANFYQRSLSNEPIAILGASGDIGRTCIDLLKGVSNQLIVAARNPARLRAIRENLPDVNVEISSVLAAVGKARLIIAATSAPTSLLPISSLQPGTIVCDVGYPKTLVDDVSRPDVLVFPGGIARLPNHHGLDSYTDLPGPDLLFGCFAEGIVLTANAEYTRLATVQGHADGQRAMALLVAAARIGIRPAPIYHNGQPLGGSDGTAFASASHDEFVRSF
jgi:fatty aldehyde-generating acyl-ACP reductase